MVDKTGHIAYSVIRRSQNRKAMSRKSTQPEDNREELPLAESSSDGKAAEVRL